MKVIHNKELQERIDDCLNSVQAIQGDNFRDLLAFVLQSSQLMRLTSIVVDTLKEHEEKMAGALADETSKALARGATLLAEAYEMTDEQMQELMKWVETIDGHVTNSFKEANK